MTSKYNNFAHGESSAGLVEIDISNGEPITMPSTRKTNKKGGGRSPR